MSIDLSPQLLEAIQAQPDASANPVLQSLLSQGDPSIGNGALPSMQDLLGQLESTNPTAGLITKYLIARQEAENQARSVEEAEAEALREAEAQQSTIEQSERLARILQRLEEIKDLRLEVEELRERTEAFAAAVGACCLCWGEDPTCPVCRGNGCPGFAIPDTQLFAQWVMPALYHLKAQKEVKGRISVISNRIDSLNVQKQKGEKNE